jgi:hypothetical protein
MIRRIPVVRLPASCLSVFRFRIMRSTAQVARFSRPGADAAGGAPDWATQAGSVLRLQVRICIPLKFAWLTRPRKRPTRPRSAPTAAMPTRRWRCRRHSRWQRQATRPAQSARGWLLSGDPGSVERGKALGALKRRRAVGVAEFGRRVRGLVGGVWGVANGEWRCLGALVSGQRLRYRTRGGVKLRLRRTV